MPRIGMRPDSPEALNDMRRDVAVASSGRFEARMREIKKLRDKSENELKNLREKSDTSSKDLTEPRPSVGWALSDVR